MTSWLQTVVTVVLKGATKLIIIRSFLIRMVQRKFFICFYIGKAAKAVYSFINTAIELTATAAH